MCLNVIFYYNVYVWKIMYVLIIIKIIEIDLVERSIGRKGKDSFLVETCRTYIL